MESLGSYLKRGRQEAGITLEQLAERTRIRQESLESLEQGDLENLPSDPYVRGFVKLVCRELGLPARDALARYEALRERVGTPDEITWSEERTVESIGRLQRALKDPERVVRRARRLARTAVVAGGALVAVLLAWGGAVIVGRAGRTVEEPQTPPEPEPTETVAEAAAEAPVARQDVAQRELALPLVQVQLATEGPSRIVPEEILVRVQPAGPGGETRDDAAERADAEGGDAPAVASSPDQRDEPVASAEPERQDESVASAVGDSPTGRATEPAAEARAGAAATEPSPVETARVEPSRTEPEPPSAVVPARTVPRPVAGARLELEVVAVRAVEVQVLLDGIGYPRLATMEPGERKSWKADSLFTVSASDGGAIRLRLAGTDLGSAGADYERLERLVIRGDR